MHLDGLLLVDPQNWALNGTVTVKQTVGGNELTFPLKLGIDPALAAINASLLATTPFSLTAILDQEDSGSPYTDNYRLWLTSASDLGAAFAMVPEPASVALLSAGMALLWILRRYWRRG
ncbi:MAG TPA: PEP-CTERM sorting domain-containing protein [Thermoguttaceae bacterium]|nr:PEP-CTERM sorting domain-containing protein [Thermoguttaceae bacterium]